MSFTRETLHCNIRLGALILFVVSLPFYRGVNNIAIIALGLNWLAEGNFGEKFERAKKSTFLLLLSLIFIISVLGLLYTQNMRHGLFELEKRVTMLLFPLVFATSKPIPITQIRLVFKMFILTCFMATMICFVYAFYRNYEEGYTVSYVFNAVFFDQHTPFMYDYFNYYYFTYHFFSDILDMHPIYLAMYMVFSSCLVIWLWWDKSRFERRLNMWQVLLLIYNFIVIVLLSSRTQLFTFVALSTIFILYYAHSKRQLLTGVLLVLCVYIASIVVILLNPITHERFTKAITPGIHYSENQHGEGGLSLRVYKWKYAVVAIQNNPIIGTGTGDAQDELQKVYKENDFKMGLENEFNPHNQYLQSTLEQGLVGLLALLACLIVPAYYSYKKGLWIYIVFIAILSLAFLTESILQLNKGIVFYTFFNSIFAFEFMTEKS